MKSPFPGMDPYLNQHWQDVHHSLCTYARDMLQPQVRPALPARVDERLVVESDFRGSRSIYPDVRIVQQRPNQGTSEAASALGVAEPILIKVESDPAYDLFIQIVDPSTGGKLVTDIEFLSLSNRTSKGSHRAIQQKQREASRAEVSVVEIDLLRGGEWGLQIQERQFPAESRQPYRACVQRAGRSDLIEAYHFPIEQPLPKLRIPLRRHDKDALLDLQQRIDQVYTNGAYDEIDYNVPPIPPLDAKTAEWAKAVLARRTLN